MLRNIAFVLLFPFMASLFQEGQLTHIRSGASLPANCNPSTGDIFFQNTPAVGIYACTAANTWTAALVGSGVANQLALWNGANTLTNLGAATNGQLPIGSTGAAPVLASLTGTTNQVNIANGAGTITFSLPQNIHTGATPQFSSLGLGVIAGGSGTLSMLGKMILYNNATPADGQLLIGNTAGARFDAATLTSGTAITITTGGGSITITNAGVTSVTGTANQVNVSSSTGAVTFSLPQNINTGANPTFASLTLTAAAPTVAAGQIGYGATTAAQANCGGAGLGATACIVVNIAGTTRYVPYF